jgi:DNA polymerase-3 subunit epsilon
MKRPQRALLLLGALGGSLLLLGAWCALVLALVGSALAPAQGQALRDLLAPLAPLMVLSALIWAGAVGALVQWAHRRWVAPAEQLAEQARVLLGNDVERELQVHGGAGLRALAQVLNTLSQQRRQLQRDIHRQVADASRDIEQERNRLAALMSELTQSVVVCNLDGWDAAPARPPRPADRWARPRSRRSFRRSPPRSRAVACPSSRA